MITQQVVDAIPELCMIRIGILHVFVQHTSASLTLNENADPDVRVDLASSLDAIAPESSAYRHTIEGEDDMPAHVKTSLTGNSLSIPIRDGRPALGTWQGICFCEHRNHGGTRRLIVTVHGRTDEQE